MDNLNATVAVFDSHEKAVKAVKVLQANDFPLDNISIIGKGEIVEDHFRPHDAGEFAQKGLAVGALVGSLLGVLTGLSLFVIPGLGVLFASGALIGGIGGMAAGGAGGGIFATLMSLGISKSGVMGYRKHLEHGRYLVICHGTKTQIENARLILNEDAQHSSIESHS